MSHQLISHNEDLKKLRDEGYVLEVKNAHLLVHNIPYVNSQKQIAYGTLVTPLGDLAGDKTSRPQDHVIHFIGEHPCDYEGNIITAIRNTSGRRSLGDGIEIDHSFSSKPKDGYADYYEKVTTYAIIISAQAQAIEPSVTARTFDVVESVDPDVPFHYIDTNSSRAEIDAISEKLMNQRIAIIGLGGTGSYLLDLVSKTPVKEIHLYDQDDFLSHNAFRAPGAASIDELRAKPRKVMHLHNIYSKMHKGIVPHDYHITEASLNELSVMSFVFICIDNGEIKKIIIDKLTNDKIPFVDVGIGIHAIDGKLTGSARITTGTSEKNDHIDKRVSFVNQGAADYDKNVQIAEINAINAALAVVKWKKLSGFYHDLNKEFNSVYDIYINKVINDETLT